MSASPHIPDEMRRVYIQRRRGDLTKLTEAAARNEAEVFHRIGHQIKGNAATYGYPDLEAIGIRLEQVANFGATSEAQALLKELAEWIEFRDQELLKTKTV